MRKRRMESIKEKITKEIANLLLNAPLEIIFLDSGSVFESHTALYEYTIAIEKMKGVISRKDQYEVIFS